MDYNKLKTFVLVAQMGSVSKAAQQLRRSQSAITQQIQLLEQELELKLFERKNARIFLSQDGETLFQNAKPHFQEMDDLIFEIKQTKEKIEGHIRLGELNDLGNSFRISLILSGFLKKYPGITFTIRQGTGPSLEQDLMQNNLDLAFLVFFSLPEMFLQYEVERTWHSLYTSRAYLDKQGPLSSYKKILTADLIDFDEHFMCLGTFFKKNNPKLAPALFRRKPNVVVANHFSAKEIVSTGYGMAILPDYLVEGEVQSGQLVKLMPSARSVYAGLDLAHRTHRTLRLCERVFRDYVLERNLINLGG